jgi:hypothetical protein|tara:strand:+ start:6915 stop:7115 length:201 start_codon:yes stop_codon:yes gene_type:complete
MSTIKKEIKVKSHKFLLEIYPSREGTADEIQFEIFPYGYQACLYAFSNKDSLNKLIKDKFIFEAKK